MKINCLIVDDEPPARRVLENYLGRMPQLALAGSCADAFEAGAVLQSKSVDLLFLDIHLPELSGISFLRTLTDPPLVIFTTAYPEYAVEGFELEALDYLVKPISFERFLKSVNKAVAELEKEEKLKHLEELPPGQTHLLVRADRKLYRVLYDDILYLQAYGDYVRVVTGKGRNITPKARLTDFERQLPEEKFLRVHRSYIVALEAIRYLEGNMLRIGEENIPVGQSYREALMERLDRR